MLIKEYRIPVPMTVDEYRIAQLYMIVVGDELFFIIINIAILKLNLLLAKSEVIERAHSYMSDFTSFLAN